MPDISMCLTTQCRKFKECYRAQAVPSTLTQSYTLFLEDTDEDKCDWFEEIKKSDKLIKDYILRCKGIRVVGESCNLNNNCTYPKCEMIYQKK